MSVQQQSLNASLLYQDPSASQSVVQPAGTTLTLSGVTSVPTPKLLGSVRYADQFVGADIGAKINAAIADLGATGGTVLLPIGTWTFNTQIVLDGHQAVTLQGMGTATGTTTSLAYAGSCGSVISARSAAGIKISGIALSTSISCSSPPLVFVDLSHSSSGSDAALNVIENSAFTGTSGTTAVKLEDAIETTIRGNNFAYVDVAIVGRSSVNTYSNVIRVENNQFALIRNSPIKNGGQAWLIQGNTFEALLDGTAGAFAHDPGVPAQSASFVSNWFGDSTANGTWIDWLGSGLDLTGNYFGSATTAVRVAGSSISVRGNVFDGTYGSSALDLAGANSGIVVGANSFPSAAGILRSTGAPLDRASIVGNVNVSDYIAEAQPTINVRTIVTKSIANSLCPAGSSAIYAPRSYAGLTGTAICAANTQTSRTCAAEVFVYVMANNQYGTWSAANNPCGTPVPFPWPWGYDWVSPSTLIPRST